ncbi:MAG: sensor histidine kinase [Solirubrobacteraceae bacterium]|nr:sensor histidine kinase [Solirubrobacteraceae bacterium]
MRAAIERMSLEGQVFLAVAALLGTAALVLVLVPVRIGGTEGSATWIVVGGTAGILLLVRIALLRALRPLRRLTRIMATVDPMAPPGDLREQVVPDDRDVKRLTAAFEEMLVRFREERRASDRRMVAAQEAERRRIARELHDELGQTLTALSLQIGRAPIDADARAPLAQTVGRALDEVRELARRLRPEALDDLGLVNALIALGTRVSEESGLPIDRRISSPLPSLPPDVELAIYRIAQEALTNVIRHAGATRAAVDLGVRGDRLVLVVEDDGRGHGGPGRPGGGIDGMRERADLVGATLDIARRPEGGTRVTVRQPLGVKAP